MEGHCGAVSCAAVLPDGRVLGGSGDGTLRVWDPATGQCLQTLEGHSNPVSCAAVLPDGRVLSGSNDGTLRVWDPDTGACLDVLEGTEVDVSRMDLSRAELTPELAKLLRQNGARVPPPAERPRRGRGGTA